MSKVHPDLLVCVLKGLADSEALGSKWTKDDAAICAQAADRIVSLEAENARLIEDRARFPDRPDDIGRMIASRFNNLKAAAKSNEDAWRRARALADSLAPDVETMTLAADAPPFRAASLLRRVVTNVALEYRRKRRPSLPFWCHLKEATSLGSNCSAGLARWAGFDADTGLQIGAVRATATTKEPAGA